MQKERVMDHMFVVRLAELNIAIDHKYDYIRDMCTQYSTDEKPNFFISVSDYEIMVEDEKRTFDQGYLESLAVYRKIAEKIIDYDGFLMHGVVVQVQECGIAFLAKSGVGKSTHVSLWQTLLGEKISVINGDKPLIRVKEHQIFAYGTPWAGKEKIHTNAKTNLKKICFIERAVENECILLDKSEVFERLIQQIYRPQNVELFLKTLDLVTILVENTEFYLVRCNTDISAAKTAYEGLML